MINQELLLLLHHIFLCLAPGYWYSLEEEDECFPTCLATARLIGTTTKHDNSHNKSKFTWQKMVAYLHWQP
jgi:hypothetical protein